MSTDKAPTKAEMDPQNLVVHGSFGRSTRWKVVEQGGSEMVLRSGQGRRKMICLRRLKESVRRLRGGGGDGDDRGDFTCSPFPPTPCPHLHQGLNRPLETVKKKGRFEAMGCEADILAPRVGR